MKLGRIARRCNGAQELARFDGARLYHHEVPGLVDAEPGLEVRGLQCLGNRADAVTAGHVFDFEDDHVRSFVEVLMGRK